ncbi:hypothetical protein IPG36_04085 [bacterium]|nr:MAG: hypothetical protein IPG36_04085 [bacterium]
MWPFIILALVASFGLGAWLGAPYLPILASDRRQLLALANLKPGQTIIDLGSGDGRLLFAAAKQGIRGIGYEINPLLVIISRIVCWRYRTLVTIHLANFWQIKLPPADAIYVFLIARYMPKLEQKLRRDITQPTLVVSYVFALPESKPIRQNATSAVYQFPAQLPKSR